MNYLDMSLTEIHSALVAKKVTPLTLTKEALKRAHEETSNAFEVICDKEALDFASSYANNNGVANYVPADNGTVDKLIDTLVSKYGVTAAVSTTGVITFTEETPSRLPTNVTLAEIQ